MKLQIHHQTLYWRFSRNSSYSAIVFKFTRFAPSSTLLTLHRANTSLIIRPPDDRTLFIASSVLLRYTAKSGPYLPLPVVCTTISALLPVASERILLTSPGSIYGISHATTKLSSLAIPDRQSIRRNPYLHYEHDPQFCWITYSLLSIKQPAWVYFQSILRR